MIGDAHISTAVQGWHARVLLVQGIWLRQTNNSPRIHTESSVSISTYHVTYFNVLSCVQGVWLRQIINRTIEYTLKALLLFQHTMLLYTVILIYHVTLHSFFQYIMLLYTVISIMLLFTVISIYHVTLQIYFNIPCHTVILIILC